jgi:hypothetical protein
MKQIFRVIQLITGVHRIHHIKHSYGWKVPFFNVALFDDYGWIHFGKGSATDGVVDWSGYHDCTTTGIY